MTAPAPRFTAIDHLHLHVRDRARAERWYAEVLGLQRVPELAHWAADGGPLTLADAQGVLHLALFERPDTPVLPQRATVALRIEPDQHAAWQWHLQATAGQRPDVVDHGVAQSLYFQDPDGNPFELSWPTAPSGGLRTDLHRLLDAGLALAPEYTDAQTAHTGPEDAYASHLPMALHALAALGASTDALARFDRQERQGLPARTPWPGLDAAEAELRLRLARDGAAAVLGDRLPQRLAHAGAVAFHGLIRTAHAWESGHLGELALALAWWAQREQPLTTPATAPAPERDLPDWWEALQAMATPDGMGRGMIATRMRAWAATPEFQRWGPALRLRASTLQDLARLSLDAYARSGNFTVLHAVTACRAMAVLGPLVPAARTSEALRDFSQHWAAAVLASGWRGAGQAPTALDWSALLPLAQGHPEDHAIKLTHAAWDWSQRGLDDRLCRQAATRALVPQRA